MAPDAFSGELKAKRPRSFRKGPPTAGDGFGRAQRNQHNQASRAAARERAEESLESGWHWNYELINVQVDKVSMRNNGAVATVDCTLEESAALFDGGKPDLTDSYKATYKARYVMEWFADAQAWKITSGVVLK